jgi:hypothetical protein
MGAIWLEGISPKQAAAKIDCCMKLIDIDHVRIPADDMFSAELVADFARKNADLDSDGGFMIDAFSWGATGSGERAKMMTAITDELWVRGYTNEDMAKIYGGNKMRAYTQVWEVKSARQITKRTPSGCGFERSLANVISLNRFVSQRKARFGGFTYSLSEAIVGLHAVFFGFQLARRSELESGVPASFSETPLLESARIAQKVAAPC